MLELVFMSCSLLAGQSCRDVHIPLLPQVTSMQCALFGQQVLGQWVMDNPNWTITQGYTCARVGTIANL